MSPWCFDADEALQQQAATAKQLGMPSVDTVNMGGGVQLDLVLIPAGRFLMGIPDDQRDSLDEYNGAPAAHWMVVEEPFYIGRHQVTQDVWEKVMGSNPSLFRDAKNPVHGVNWNDCHDFITRLASMLGTRGPFRLPSVSEWEWACRAGTKTKFCGGDDSSDLSDYGWYRDNSGDRVHPVGAKKPNAWGLYDMHGNVFEWCDNRSETSQCQQEPVAGGNETVVNYELRGGGWSSEARYCRSGNTHVSRSIKYVVYGFRVLRPLKGCGGAPKVSGKNEP